MQVHFKCLNEGKRLYSVSRNQREVFVGTRGECVRFLEIHNSKVAQEHTEWLRTPRARPVVIRTYRQAQA
jgi:hypothetical protein